MYEVEIYNDNNKTIIHSSNTSKDAPHLLNLNLKESLSRADELSFSIPFGNIGYRLIEGLVTKVKVINLKDNTIEFTGRVLNIKDGMNSNGEFLNEVICEGAMNFLYDSQTRRWHFQDSLPSEIIRYLLDRHNEKVDDSRKIYLGDIEVNQKITIDTNYETTLNVIISKIHNIIGGDIKIREKNGILFLDYLMSQGKDNGVEVRLRHNLKEILREYDPSDLVTRLIPLGYGEGINQLTIESVNNNIEYIDDLKAIEKYGVIEGVLTNKDIQNANTLKIYVENVLSEKKQPALIFEQTALDLSLLTGHENEKYNLGDYIRTIVDIMNIDVKSRVIARERDLINDPWNPKLTISTRANTLSNQITELKQKNLTLENSPQGSTYIDTFGYAENIDETHSFKLPIWLSPDILYVNRVRLHIDSLKFRAYEKGLSTGGQSSITSSAGGGSTATSSAGGGSTETTSTQDNHRHMVFKNIENSAPADDFINAFGFNYSKSKSEVSPAEVYLLMSNSPGVNNIYTYEAEGEHEHEVEIPEHEHQVEIPEHEHEVEIPEHEHEIEYGIFEDTYPADVEIKVNGISIPEITLSEGGSIDIDISKYIGTPGETYNLEVTSSRNGRVNVWVSIQAFIQVK